eukprot:11174973-Heterocapsa_arctica.AAC.1
MIIAAYCPPPGSLPRGLWTKAVDSIMGWITMQLQAAPHRCTPILGLDLNDEMGWMKDEQGQHKTGRCCGEPIWKSRGIC